MTLRNRQSSPLEHSKSILFSLASQPIAAFKSLSDNSEALFKQDKSASKHDVNVNYHKYNFRTNIDADLTKTTMLSLNLEAVIKTQNAPGTGSSNKYLWESQANLPPTVVPVRYSNGQLPAYGTNLEINHHQTVQNSNQAPRPQSQKWPTARFYFLR